MLGAENFAVVVEDVLVGVVVHWLLLDLQSLPLVVSEKEIPKVKSCNYVACRTC